MALIDSLDILSDKQIVNNTCYSRYCKKFKAPSDWGQTEMQRYIEILCHGTHAHPLTVQVVGSNNDSHSDEFVICQTTEIPVAKLKAGYKFFIPIPPIGQKYRFLALKYLPTGGSNPSATSATLTGGIEVTDFATLKGVTDGSFKITVDGEEITATAIDLSSQSTGANIATALTAKMNSKATVTYADNKFVVTSATTGVSSTISAMSGGGSGTDISEIVPPDHTFIEETSEFIGWCLSGEDEPFTGPVTEDITLYPEWESGYLLEEDGEDNHDAGFNQIQDAV